MATMLILILESASQVVLLLFTQTIQHIVVCITVQTHLLMIVIRDVWINVIQYNFQVLTIQPANVSSNVLHRLITTIKIIFVYIIANKQDILLIHQQDNVSVVVQM